MKAHVHALRIPAALVALCRPSLRTLDTFPAPSTTTTGMTMSPVTSELRPASDLFEFPESTKTQSHVLADCAECMLFHIRLTSHSPWLHSLVTNCGGCPESFGHQCHTGAARPFRHLHHTNGMTQEKWHLVSFKRLERAQACPMPAVL